VPAKLSVDCNELVDRIAEIMQAMANPQQQHVRQELERSLHFNLKLFYERCLPALRSFPTLRQTRDRFMRRFTLTHGGRGYDADAVARANALFTEFMRSIWRISFTVRKYKSPAEQNFPDSLLGRLVDRLAQEHAQQRAKQQREGPQMQQQQRRSKQRQQWQRLNPPPLVLQNPPQQQRQKKRRKAEAQQGGGGV